VTRTRKHSRSGLQTARLALVVLALSLAACARPDEAWERVRETGVLRVGMDASFPPFESIAADGTLVGFDVDLARELGRRLGVEVQFVANLPYDGLYDALTVGQVDVVISALVVNPARRGDFAYSRAYFDAGQVLVTPDRPGAGPGTCQAPVAGMADMAGCTVAVELGTQGDLEARKWARRLADLTIVTCQTADEALTTVRAGEADAAVVDHVSALMAIERGGQLTVVGQPVSGDPYAVAVRRQSQHLLRAIDEALTEMEEDGTIDRLTARWLRE